jgi:membrane fusion protein (multidrug efflux system)
VLDVGDDSIARRTDVQIGRRRVGHVEILSGIEEGARVVVEGLVRVQVGSPVDVVGVRESRS